MSKTPSQIADETVKLDMPFSGTPQKYFKLCIVGSIAIHAYLFIGYWAIKNLLAAESWPNGWLWPVITLVSTVWFGWYSYNWILRLDARLGKGSGWIQEPITVKLPWEKSPKH